MSLNTSHYGTNGVLLFNGEMILIYYDGVEVLIQPHTSLPIMNGNKKGRIYLTSHRIVFINKNHNDLFQSFSMPFGNMRNLEIEQPVFGANYIKGEVKSESNGRWDGTAKFKLWFNNGGAIDFGQCLLNAGKLASQARAAREFVYTQVNNGNIYPAPPPAYTTLNANNYGWVPLDRFPDRPQGNTVFMYDQPPPYGGIYPEVNTNKFDERQKVPNVQNGFVNPNDPSKIYYASAQQEDPLAPPPSYQESLDKKKG